MKRFSIFLAIAILPAVSALSMGLKVGTHGAYSLGGDIEDGNVGFGANASIDLPGSFAAEVSGTRFSLDIDDYVGNDVRRLADSISYLSDDDSSIDSEATVLILAATVQTGMELGDLFYGYIGAGISYNVWDYSLNYSGNGTIGGAAAGIEANVSLENAIGYHACAGAEIGIGENWEVFGDYQYTVSKLEFEGSGSVSVGGTTLLSQDLGDSEDISYGLLRLGVRFRF